MTKQEPRRIRSLPLSLHHLPAAIVAFVAVFVSILGIGSTQAGAHAVLAAILAFCAIGSTLLTLRIFRRVRTLETLFSPHDRAEDATSDWAATLARDLPVLTEHLSRFFESTGTILESTQTILESAKNDFETVRQQFRSAQSGIEQIKESLSAFSAVSQNLDREVIALQGQSTDVMGFNQTLVIEMTGQELEIAMASGTMASMILTIQEIARMAQEKMGAFEDLQKTASDGQNQMSKSREATQRIALSTQAILQASVTIQKIAAQTSVLAMNAAIEAAHAGEYGRGFSVVASEIKRLSESTTESSKRITQTIKETVADIQTADSASLNATAYFQKLIDGVESFSAEVEQIKSALVDLSEKSGGVTSSIQIITKSMALIKQSTLEMNSKNMNSLTTLGQLSNLSHTIVETVEKVSELAGQLGEEMVLGQEKGQQAQQELAQVAERLVEFKSR